MAKRGCVPLCQSRGDSEVSQLLPQGKGNLLTDVAISTGGFFRLSLIFSSLKLNNGRFQLLPYFPAFW